MTISHPMPTELESFARGDQLSDTPTALHVAGCAQCSAAVVRLAPQIDMPAFSLPEGAAEVPAALRRDGGPDTHIRPQLSDVWQAVSEAGEVLLVWLRRTRPDGRFAAVPVSFDREYADDYSLILDATESAFGVDLVLHTTSESTIDPRVLRTRVGALDVGAVIDQVRESRRSGRPSTLNVGPPIVSSTDERLIYRQSLTETIAAMTTARFERDPDLTLDDDVYDSDLSDDGAMDEFMENSVLVSLLREVRHALDVAYPAARLLPSGLAGETGDRVVFMVAHIDALVAVVATSLDLTPAAPRLELCRELFLRDTALTAVCLTDSDEPFDAHLVDRRDLVDAYEPPSGRISTALALPEPAPLSELILKYFDRVVNPFRHVIGVGLEPIAIDLAALAVDVANSSVTSTVASASGFKIPGKADGFEAVESHRAAVVEAVTQAVNGADLDLDSLLGPGH